MELIEKKKVQEAGILKKIIPEGVGAQRMAGKGSGLSIPGHSPTLPRILR